ncbi:MAG: hypothetical protein FWC51_04675, partial [Proteobacteria bacterium]|nr:hypothetical protein [Pseudomonadota bacterium]
AMMTGAYVAQIAMGADNIQAIRAIREAEAFPGPSIILAYSPCIAHGYDLANSPAHSRMLVDSGAWPLFRFNPLLIEQGKNPLIIDSGASVGAPREAPLQGGDADPELVALEKFFATETRFSSVNAMNPTRFARLLERAASDNEYRRELKRHIAAFVMQRKSPKVLQG